MAATDLRRFRDLAVALLTLSLANCGPEPSAPPASGTTLKVIAMSQVPDPATAAYPACLVHFVAEKDDGERVNAISWAFRDRQPSPAAGLEPGDELRVELRPYAEVAQALKREMAAADAGDLELPEVWLEQIYQINGSKAPLATTDAPPQSEAASATVEKIHRVLAAHGPGGIGREGAHDWLFAFNFPELHDPDFLTPTDAELGELSGPLPVIVDFKRELEKHGIALVFVVAPLKVHLFPGYATNLPYDMEVHGRIDLATQALLAALKEEGVLAIDCVSLLGQQLWEEYSPGKFTPIYSPYHHHWSSYGAKLVAEEVIAVAVAAGFASETLPNSPVAYNKESALPPDEWIGSGPWPGRPRQLFTESFWVAPPIGENPAGAEVLLLGDSFCHLWSDRNASFHEHLSAGFGQKVAQIIANGSSATFTRQRLAREWSAYQNLKLVVWEVSEAYLVDKELWQPVKLSDRIDLDQHLASATISGGQMALVSDPETLRERSAGIASAASAKPVRVKWEGIKLGDMPKFVTALCHPLVEGAPDSDGVTFAVYIDGKRVSYRSIRPPTVAKPSSFAKQWAVPLADFANQTIALELVVEPRNSPDGDRGIWVEPTILDGALGGAKSP